MEHPVVIDSLGKTSYTASPSLISNSGLAALAQAMAAPIRRNLNYHGIARRCLQVQPLPQGALLTYDRDIDVASCLLEEDKFQHNVITINSRGHCDTAPHGFLPPFRRVKFPTFEIVNNPTIRLDDIKQRRFNLLDRGVQVNRPSTEKCEPITINSSGKVNTRAKNRRFTVIDRAVQKVRQEIMAQEDANIFAMLDDLGKK